MALLMTAALFVPAAAGFDFYYDLNDDVLIKDVLSGVYSGTPDGHTMQLLYPLGFLLSLFYRILSIPVFGAFLVLCQYGSIFVIAYRTVQQCQSRRAKLAALAAEGIFWAAAFGYHLVFVQYTVTAGMLAGAAVFWVLTADCGGKSGSAGGAGGGSAAGHPVRAFLKENIPAFLLYWLAFCLRSEMGLLLLPLAGAAGLCRWAQEEKVSAGENVRKYLGAFGVLAMGLVVCLGLDSLAYAGDGWPAFRQFFDERTELYDYQLDFINNYEENEAYYSALGMTETRQRLLENYNFGVDDSMDEALLVALKEAALSRPGAGGFWKKSLSEGLWSLLYGHWVNRTDAPFNFVLILCGLSALCLGLFKGRRYLLWQVPLCTVTGAALWLFLLLRDRPADRVFHPLYLGQILVFTGLLLLEVRKEGQEQAVRAAGNELPGPAASERAGRPGKAPGRLAAAAAAGLVCLLCLSRVFGTLYAVSEEYARRERVNRTNEAVMAYCSAHPGRLYLEDVYSTVTFSEKIAADRDKPFNYDLLGGWLVKSPLTGQKLAAFGYETMGEAVRAGGNVSLLAEAGTDMHWLDDYFAEAGILARVVKTGTITEAVEVYQVLPESTGESWK